MGWRLTMSHFSSSSAPDGDQAIALASAIARTEYRDLALYSPERSPCAVDLSDNTNLWGMPPAALRALGDVSAATFSRYPSLYAHELREELAAYLTETSGVSLSARWLTTGCGSDDVLDSAIRAFTRPGDTLAYIDPTFPMIPTFARMNGVVPVPVPLADGVRLDADAILRTEARIIYLCSPNNPTGATLAREQVEAVVRHAPGVVILDEAYAEFAGDTFVNLLAKSDRLLVTRTMSKAFGLAGLRVGYAAGAPALVAEVEKSRGPYKVNALAERAALAVLREDASWVQRRVREAQMVRARLMRELEALELRPLESSANFVLVPVAGAERIAARMRATGVATRAFGELPGIGDALRITVGPWEMMDAVLRALRSELLSATAGLPGTP